MTDFAPLSDADWPGEIADRREGFAGRLNVYRAMAHHPALLRAWGDLRDHVVRRTSLGAEASEVVILRAGHRLGAGYEWAHHVVRGRAAGLSDPRIAALRGPLAGMGPGDALLAGAVDELIDGAALSPARLADLAAAHGREGVLDLMATVGMYSTLAFVVKSFGTPVDEDVAAAPPLDARG